MNLPAGQRAIVFKCPTCGDEETQIKKIPKGMKPLPPQVETIDCRCGKCFSEALDRAFPGAREWRQRRVRS